MDSDHPFILSKSTRPMNSDHFFHISNRKLGVRIHYSHSTHRHFHHFTMALDTFARKFEKPPALTDRSTDHWMKIPVDEKEEAMRRSKIAEKVRKSHSSAQLPVMLIASTGKRLKCQLQEPRSCHCCFRQRSQDPSKAGWFLGRSQSQTCQTQITPRQAIEKMPAHESKDADCQSWRHSKRLWR